jgi:glutamate synthase (NADPH/NADH) large chain
MSGGVAYVLDLRAQRVNAELVAVRPVTDQESELVRALVQRHQDETGSAVARKLLADWDGARVRFSTVMPRDYARVIEVRREAEAEGLDLDGDVVWKRIMEVSHA